MQIATSLNDNCVNHGLSIMRAALGYTGPLPDSPEGSKSVPEICNQVGKWFPDHNVHAYCLPEEWPSPKHDNVSYKGERIPEDDGSTIAGFAYGTAGSNDAHFVVGQPVKYPFMKLALAVRVIK